MEAALYLSDASQASMVLQSIRSELTSAVRNALVRHAYDTDVQLSFGTIHINSKGSVSQISFNGADVTDQEAFIVKQAFHISDNQYFDIRTRIKDEPDSFYFYPILIRDKVSFTILKSSPYFENRYGSGIHDESVRVEYASKYMLIYRSDFETPDVYYVGLFTPEATANMLLEKAGKSLGGKSTVYYCFLNSRPEMFLHLGQTKRDFAAYHPDKAPASYNFYKGSVISGIFRMNKKTDDNGKVKVKESRKKCLQMVIKIQYGTVDRFCELFDIDQLFFTAYLSGAEGTIKKKNGDTITPTRLDEMLNLSFSPDAESMKDKNLLIRVDYDEIPA